MDKGNIKKYATWARRELISRVSQRAAFYEITKEHPGTVGEDHIAGRILTDVEKAQRDALVALIQKDGYEQTMEEVAYTWFNRFCALRYMEVNNYLPSHVRVFTDDAGAFKPQILTEALNLELDGLDMDRVIELKSANKTEQLYRYLLIVQCNALSRILPGMFQKIEDYTELLLPDNLLLKGSVIEQMVTLIPEEDWTDQVQIIGWLYQYYNAEKKDEVFAALKKNVKITKENIPAATQLFTPDWIVRYMVENSLGRIFIQWSVGSGQWAESERIEKEKEIASEFGWKYYIPEAEQTPEVRAQLATNHCTLTTDFQIEDLKVIDPCAGSGHILVYMFDVLVQIYEAYGYTARDAAGLIVQNNLYGLDIDDRAAQLAYFAVMMKARSYDRRFFSRGCRPNVYAIRESNDVKQNAVAYFVGGAPALKKAMSSILADMQDAKEYGSIINVRPVDFAALYARFDEIADDTSWAREYCLTELLPLVRVAEMLAMRYSAVITNPPYMGSSNMGGKLGEFVKKNYPNTKADLSTVFMEKTIKMCSENGYMAMINIPVWMFLVSFEKQRHDMLCSNSFSSLIHLGRGIFGADFGTVAFTIKKTRIPEYKATYLRLFDKASSVDTPEEKEQWYLERKGLYVARQEDFQAITGMPIAYWISEALLNAFKNFKSIGDVGEAKQGLITGDNERFLREWYEIDHRKIGSKWFVYHKGGDYRKWYGNNSLVVNWENDGYEIINFIDPITKRQKSRPQNVRFYFRPGFTWTTLSIGAFSARYMPEGQVFDAKGSAYFANSISDVKAVMALTNSNVGAEFFKFLSPTVDYSAGSVAKLPIAPEVLSSGMITSRVDDCIEVSTSDWDAFETSWDFKRHPLVANSQRLIADSYTGWENECNTRFNQLKANEEELNRIFIDIYGLQDELTPEVEAKDVTVRKADLGRDIRSLISYAVGCMFGRYSLDVEGLAYTGGEFSDQWAVVSGQYYNRKAVEYYVSCELSRAYRVAEGNGYSDGSVSADKDAAEGGIVFTFGSDETGGSVDPLKYRRGTRKKLYEGIRKLSVDCTGVEGGTGDPAYDLCSPEILAAIASENGAELVSRGWKDAERIDWKTVHCTLTTDHYCPDKDGIIPICDDEYFADDIVNRFVEFVKTVFGESTLDENLRFIAKALGGSGQPRDVIRSYFLNDFYADHLKIYQKRPIYWLFDSGKKNGFKCLIYMHRYRPDTIARIRTDYLHEQQARYRTAIAGLEQQIENAGTAERVRLNKQLVKLKAQAEEARIYEEKIHHLADQMIPIDLDDGVKVNYAKFQDVLAKIK